MESGKILKTTISNAEDDTFALLTGCGEDEGNDLDKRVFRAMRKLEY
jgi:hypothetical protein